MKRTSILKRLEKKIAGEAKVKQDFPRVYYPGTSDKPVTEMK